MDDQPDLEQQDTRSRVWRNRAMTAVGVSATALLATLWLQLVFGPTDTADQHADPTVSIVVISDGNKTQDWSLPSDIPFYNGGENRNLSGLPYGDDQIIVTTDRGCDTKYGAYRLRINGLTPGGNYWIQTDWDHDYSFGYGHGGYANNYGQATYAWDCFDATGYALASGLYTVHVTDASTGFSATIALPVGNK